MQRDRAVVLCLCLVLAGCGSDGPTRIPLTGQVTQGGQPVKQGAILLVPAQGHRGVAANTAIKDGRYQFTSDDGPGPGPYKVTVMMSLTKDELMRRGQDQNVLAPQMQWEFEIKVPDSGSASEDFRLDSKESRQETK